MHLKKWHKHWDVQKGITLRVMLASRPKVNFDQMATPVLEIMDRSGICHKRESIKHTDKICLEHINVTCWEK
jgi:hypothetical protein